MMSTDEPGDHLHLVSMANRMKEIEEQKRLARPRTIFGVKVRSKYNAALLNDCKLVVDRSPKGTP